MASFTPKQKQFIYHYCETLNGTKSARLAGYKGNNNQLGVIAHQNLRKRNIKEQIARNFERTMPKTEVLQRLGKIAKGDLSNYANVTTLEQLEEHPDSYNIKKIKSQTTISSDGAVVTIIELELHDPQSALDKLARAHDLYKNSININEPKKPDNFDNALNKIYGDE